MATVEVTPEYVSSLDRPTEVFLCPLSYNVYKIDFVGFKIRAIEDDREEVLLEIRKDEEDDLDELPLDDSTDDSVRLIRYHFGPGILDVQTIGTSLEFVIGEHPIHNFRMIERHYFRDILIKSFDFTMPFVMPNTTNSWEVMYTMPTLDPELRQAIMDNPWETKSDSFYFVENQLVMHNKADYNYSEDPAV
eukprot:TRINITY_DN21845_c0_g1_i1.p1 TRINITY_DN21845_c0_g1~~TRINITY_DN21845_c0_g1_i1.p1  ORF type:complete len:204 (-),score=31.91 TRINITY_DN21845_c0_g1_i1:46-618(-)